MGIELRNELIKKHIGKKVKHFKGKEYLILDIAEHTETGEEMVVYKALYDECKVWVRPLRMFSEPVDKVKYPNAEQDFRFDLVDIEIFD